jgi:hypothetical protein
MVLPHISKGDAKWLLQRSSIPAKLYQNAYKTAANRSFHLRTHTISNQRKPNQPLTPHQQRQEKKCMPNGKKIVSLQRRIRQKITR